jgi:hypothetical protein
MNLVPQASPAWQDDGHNVQAVQLLLVGFYQICLCGVTQVIAAVWECLRHSAIQLRVSTG